MSTFRFDVLTLFPEAFTSILEDGIIGRAFSKEVASLHLYNPRDFTSDAYRKVDDEPYGGGPGMVLKPEPFFTAIDSIPVFKKRRVIMMTPQGIPLHQNSLSRWSKNYDQLVLICGNYEGFDERIRTLVDEEISIGDFILTGGEIPAMLIVNGVVRLLPGALGSSASLEDESHTNLLLEHPQYTRPAEYRGLKVPDVLRSGNHSEIINWRQNQRELKTKSRRADLYEKWLSKTQSER